MMAAATVTVRSGLPHIGDVAEGLQPAAIFAIPTAAFSESVYIGPGGVRIGLATTAITIATKEEDAAQNCGRLAFTRNSWGSKEWAIARDIAHCATSTSARWF